MILSTAAEFLSLQEQSRTEKPAGNNVSSVDDIGKDFDLHLFLDITINEKGNVSEVIEKSRKASRSGDQTTNEYLSNLLMETIKDMPKWVPAKEKGVNVTSTIQDEFHFTGESE